MRASMVSWMGCCRLPLALIAATAFLGNYSAFGQCADVTNDGTCADASSDTCDPNLNHGNGARIGPAANCVGETLRMTGEWFWGDSFLDAWVATDGTLTVGGVPQGSQPITLISGNAVCTGGAACTGALPNAGCTFPCVIGPPGCSCSGSGLTLPGAPTNGVVRIRGDNYVVQPGDNGKVATFTFPSTSFSTCAGAPFSQLAATSAALQVPNCSDTNPCNIDCCSLGVCSHPSTCAGATCRDVNGTVTTFPPLVCNDNSDCTGPDTCNASLPNSSPQQCCSFPTIPCPTPDVCHRQEECEADGGCPPQTSACDDPTFSCDDSDVCTTDTCDDTALGAGCCLHEPIPCDPRECFNVDCDKSDGCVYTSTCETNPNQCDDGNACTEDTCDPNTKGCCTHTNICVCGDGNIDLVEACDGDSRATGVVCTDACTAQCTCCGDGVVNGTEYCDGSAGCRADCTACGDGILNNGEQCDGNVFEAGAPAGHGECRSDCTFCGDGNPDGGEMCDDGNATNNDNCSNNCTNGCGNGILNTGEDCDGGAFEAGAPSGHGECRADCTYCGNGSMDGGETCDDGNSTNTDGCRNNCTKCGDGIEDAGEACDDGNTVNTDACSNDCTEGCGNGILNTGEECDGTQFEADAPTTHGECRADCTYCGNGTMDGNEECDDGNAIDTDVCKNDCTIPVAEETCRTPGFWDTHACGTDGVHCEKPKSTNLTGKALAQCGGCIEVCGDIINTTILNNSDSALEAMCVAVSGSPVRQLARQLTSAALNCCISAFPGTCAGSSISDEFAACNSACAAGNTSATVNGVRIDCIQIIDDFNNGRISDCHERNVGTCSNGAICTDQLPCAVGSCGGPGPAGSSNACNAATGNKCYVIGTTDCAGSDDSNSSQDCGD